MLALDPNGEESIMRSKAVRRDAMRGHRRAERDWIESVADAHFGLPAADNDPASQPPRDVSRDTPVTTRSISPAVV